MSENALRSIESTIALRICSLSNGGRSRLTSRLPCVLVACMMHCNDGACSCRPFISSGVSSAVKVRSNFPVAIARIIVERLAIMVYSIASRYGRPGFQ